VGGGENGGAGKREYAGLGVAGESFRARRRGKKKWGKKNGGKRKKENVEGGGGGVGCGPAGARVTPFLTCKGHARHPLVTRGSMPR
jgi:hypothetical protein